MIKFDVLIEIPRGCRNKYEFDKKSNRIRLDRVLYSPISYPIDYGFIPNTISDDGDPMDVLVFLTEPSFPGCLIEVNPIGVFLMIDDKKRDEKIICVPIHDPNYNEIKDISEIPIHTKKEIEHFFSVYKHLENKIIKIEGWKGKKEAISLYKKSCI